MSNKLIVPARLEKAANELKDNMVILKGCSDEVKEVIVLAQKQHRIVTYTSDGIKSIIPLKGNDSGIAYCLPDDCEIVVQDEKPQIPQIKDGFTVCEIRTCNDKSFIFQFPDGSRSDYGTLPAALRCEGWVFKGWLHEGISDIIALPFGFVSGQFFYSSCGECFQGESSTTYASVWKKREE